MRTDLKRDRSVLFFSCSNPRHYKILYDFGIRETLVSYFYIRKSEARFMDIIERSVGEGGVFMTDSGGHSFLNIKTGVTDEMRTEAYWVPFIEEYVEWVTRNRHVIYCIANMDLEQLVGREVVNKWNKKYFEPLMKYFEVIYVAHEGSEYGDPYGVNRFTEYAKKYPYVGINNDLYRHAAKFYTLAKTHRTRIHGFGWTSIPMLKRYPFFSCDSTTWLSGEKFGVSYMYDGKNFRANSAYKKHLRKTDKVLCDQYGIDFDKLLREDATEVDKYNLAGWLGGRKEYLKASETKLTGPPIAHFIKKSS